MSEYLYLSGYVGGCGFVCMSVCECMCDCICVYYVSKRVLENICGIV